MRVETEPITEVVVRLSKQEAQWLGELLFTTVTGNRDKPARSFLDKLSDELELVVAPYPGRASAYGPGRRFDGEVVVL